MNMATEAFLKNRMKGLGGSDMGAVLGVSKFKTPVDVFLGKMGQKQIFTNDLPLKFGTYMEAFVCNEYEARTQRSTIRHNRQLTSDKFPYLVGNVDRLVVPEGKRIAATPQGRIITDRGMEAKTASAYGGADWGDEGSDEVLPEYRIQCEVYMMLTGCSMWDLAVLIGNHAFKVYEMKSDPELSLMIREAAIEFWEKYVLTKTPPPPTCERDVARLFPNSREGRKLQADVQMRKLFEQLKASRAALAGAEAASEAVEVAIKAAMGDAEELVDGSDVLVSWKSSAGRRSIDSKVLKAKYPEIFKEVSVTGDPSRRFVLKGAK
jgi:putative phage-type endonuclease